MWRLGLIFLEISLVALWYLIQSKAFRVLQRQSIGSTILIWVKILPTQGSLKLPVICQGQTQPWIRSRICFTNSAQFKIEARSLARSDRCTIDDATFAALDVAAFPTCSTIPAWGGPSRIVSPIIQPRVRGPLTSDPWINIAVSVNYVCKMQGCQATPDNVTIWWNTSVRLSHLQGNFLLNKIMNHTTGIHCTINNS